MNQIQYHYYNGTWSFWLFDKVGLSYKNVCIHKLLFSERNGYAPGMMIGRFYFRVLRRGKS